jgi:hypothetical protein
MIGREPQRVVGVGVGAGLVPVPVLVLGLALGGCATAREPQVPRFARMTLDGTDHAPHALPASDATLTVLVFFSAHCPAMAAHDPILVDLATTYRPRGVRFFAIDSEDQAGLDRDAKEADARRYPFPILLDPSAAAADAVGAEYSTFSVVIDALGQIRYRGGIDSARVHGAAQQAFLADALDDVLAGVPVRKARGVVLGCALQKR